MLLDPASIALTAASLLVGTFTLYACGVGAHILLKWNPKSADEIQLQLERKTYLVSSILNHVLSVELITLFMFIAAADRLHQFFTGAMCAAGVLNANPLGEVTLMVRTASFLCCGIWLVVNKVDTQIWDFPLIRVKYAFLLFMGPLLIAEGTLQTMFLAGLDPQVLTSCCGVVFSTDSVSLKAEMAHLPPKLTAGCFYIGMGLTMIAGTRLLRTGRSGLLYSLLSIAVFILALLALMAYFCLYVYESPSHHCPYCMLQREYHFVGYFFYAALLLGVIAGASIGLIGRFRRKTALNGLIESIQKRLCRASMLGYSLFTLAVSIPVVFGDFKLAGN